MISKEILSIESFDPLNVNIDYVYETIQLLPADGHIDDTQAEQLATRFLRCADYCSDLLAQAIRHVAGCETAMKSTRADAIEKKIASGVSATAAKELFGNDERFIKASRCLATAAAWQGWIDHKYQNLLKAHHHCKEIMKGYMLGKPSSGWGGDIGENQYENVNPSEQRTGVKRGETDW